jgi:hypothetical protein
MVNTIHVGIGPLGWRLDRNEETLEPVIAQTQIDNSAF